jgi:RNA polymerase sigma-32 factor
MKKTSKSRNLEVSEPPLKSTDIVVSEPLSPAVPAKDRDLLSTYIREMNRFPLLTPEEEKSLFKEFKETGDIVIYRKLVTANLRFVVKLAFEYSKYGARILDLIQEGNVGLLRAVREFDPSKDVRLTTYAVWWIKSYMQDFLLKNWSIVKIGTTAAQKKLFYRLKKEQERLEREGIKPEPAAIAMSLGVDESDVKLMQERMAAKDLSFDQPMPGTSHESPRELTFENKVADLDPLASEQIEIIEQQILFKKALKEFLVTLDPRDQIIFKERLLSETPKTLLEIGEEHGFSKERARQIEERLKEKLKLFLQDKYPEISVN